MHSSRMPSDRLLTASRSIWVSLEGVSARGIVYLGACMPKGVYPSMQWNRHPPSNRITDRFQNITLPQTSFAGDNKKACTL